MGPGHHGCIYFMGCSDSKPPIRRLIDLILTRGLVALTLTLFFSTTLFAEYLYKDEVVSNPDFTEQIDAIGEELFETTGISLYLVMIRELENDQTIAEYELELAKDLKEPFVILGFSELDKQVDILAHPASLYNDFDKKQILSPNGTFIGAVVSTIMFARSFDEIKELMSNYGGTILPVISQKAKDKDITSKYSVGLFNGYSDTAEQIAASKGVELKKAAGSGSKDFINILRLVFYGTILYAILMYIKQKYFRKKRENEQAE